MLGKMICGKDTRKMKLKSYAVQFNEAKPGSLSQYKDIMFVDSVSGKQAIKFAYPISTPGRIVRAVRVK
jgi:hypothetical protein